MTIIELFPNQNSGEFIANNDESQLIDAAMQSANSGQAKTACPWIQREMWGEPHNGWPNYETWQVYFSIAAEDAVYRYWLREAARELARETFRKPQRGHDRPWHPPLFSRLTNAFYATPLVSDFGVHSKLLMLALGRVDWQRLATRLRQESAKPFGDGRISYPPNSLTDGRSRFYAGGVTASHGVLNHLSDKELVDAVIRHQRGDWGNVDARQRGINERGIDAECRLISAYESKDGTEFWVVTDYDRAATNVLLPSEY